MSISWAQLCACAAAAGAHHEHHLGVSSRAGPATARITSISWVLAEPPLARIMSITWAYPRGLGKPQRASRASAGCLRSRRWRAS